MSLLQSLRERGLVDAVTAPEVEKALESPLTVYCGFDPSNSSLQAGNLVSVMMLRRLQLAGHRVIALVGGATGLIGDPSGKSAERKMLTREEVAQNAAGIRADLSKVLDFDGPNPAVLVDNLDWYGNVSAIEFLRDIAVNFRVPQMLAKESVKKRLEASEGALTFTEFSYQILQGNDFLHLHDAYGCTLEVGGSDQWGNITAGTDLVHRMRGKAVWGLTFPLVCDSTGRKFGKSEGNALFMDQSKTSVFDWYQFFLRSADADVIRYLKVFTLLSDAEIAALEEETKARPEARAAQKRLAEEMTRLVHGEQGLAEAQAATSVLFGGSVRGLPASMLETIFANVKSGTLKAQEAAGRSVVEVAAECGFFPSRSEARRMAAQGGLSLNSEKIGPERAFAPEDFIDGRVAVLRAGKKNHFLVRLEKED